MTVALEFDDHSTGVAPAIIGASPAIRDLREAIASVARTHLPVLIQGPTGAGKELVAEALHVESGRTGAFVPFNVCALGDSMFEDALFGHVRGAFTGAHQDSPGYLREADGGTVFLDEISGLSRPLQAKLLRAIETGVFRSVGAKRDTRSDFRVVAATNEQIDLLVVGGQFRSDLAHRLGGVTLRVPPLAERLDDIPLLVHHFAAKHGVTQFVGEDVTQVLASYPWPGNVRELRHVVDHALAFGGGRVQAKAFKTVLDARTAAMAPMVLEGAEERHALRAALDSRDWDTAMVAKDLGIHRATLYRRMKRLGLDARVVARPNVKDSRIVAERRANSRESARTSDRPSGSSPVIAVT